jgi:orotate phosphoribosyltransferase
MSLPLLPHQLDFIRFCIHAGVLKCGQFILKSGRESPYFFDLGMISDGRSMTKLAQFYLDALQGSPLWKHVESIPHGSESKPVTFYGPPYKGIVLASALTMKIDELFPNSQPHGFAYSRKEVKDHGEGGQFVGSTLLTSTVLSSAPHVVIVDDVITSGTAVLQSLNELANARTAPIPLGLIVAIDRQEPSSHDPCLSATEYLQKYHGLNVVSIITLDLIIEYLKLLSSNSLPFSLSSQESSLLDWLRLENGLEYILSYRSQQKATTI